MRPMPLDDQMMRLRQKAQEREERLTNQAHGGALGLPNGVEDDTGVAFNEHADTWGFSWMPAIEDFVEQVTEAEQRDGKDREDRRGDGDGDYSDEEEPELTGRVADSSSRRSSRDPNDSSGDGDLLPGNSSRRSGRKRGRPQASGASSSRRRAPRPPSYNETLLADKSFHNPHASETMADAFGIFRPASFVVDVGADDRTWGGAAEAAAAAAKKSSSKVGDIDSASGGGGETEDRNWFYNTVRDRQNRLWADTRVRKGVELARKGQHQAAIDIYTQALGMCPEHDDGLVARGAAFATTGRLRQAMQDLSQALSINPRNDNASSYLKETRRRIERQETRASPGAVSAENMSSKIEVRADSGLKHILDLSGRSATVDATESSAMLAAGNAERDEVSTAALGTFLPDGMEGDALRKMRVLLEEDERKRKRGEGGVGRRGGGEDGSSRKKKSRKKEKKSSSKSKRSSSSRHKKRNRREGGGGEGRYGSSSSSSSSSSGSSDGEAGMRSSSSKKKKKRHHKRKKRSSVGSRNEEGGHGSGGAVSASLSAEAGGKDSGGEAHPILQRKKHSLWG